MTKIKKSSALCAKKLFPKKSLTLLLAALISVFATSAIFSEITKQDEGEISQDVMGGKDPNEIAEDQETREQEREENGDKDEVHEGGDDEDEKDEVQPGKYQTNAAGDQFIRIGLMPNFPINFDDKMYVGAAAQIGYYRFLTSWLALGAELMVGYNPTKGNNSFAFIPLTVGVIFQPYIWRFEFPFTVSVGLAFETCENKKYFPGFASKTEFDVYYRINDSWSVGLGYEAWYLPQWNPTTKGADNDYGIFMSVLAAARYHF